MAIRTAIKNILSKAKSIGSSILSRLKPKNLETKGALEGLNALKEKPGFNKLPVEKQRQLIQDYISKIPFTK